LLFFIDTNELRIKNKDNFEIHIADFQEKFQFFNNYFQRTADFDEKFEENMNPEMNHHFHQDECFKISPSPSYCALPAEINHIMRVIEQTIMKY
jgi:hypothetical protein